jgi:hypothetical protein
MTIAACRKMQKGDPPHLKNWCKYQQTVFNLAYHYVGYRNEVEDVAQKSLQKFISPF